jgi:tetratricopeptide (TPR) repeat protein
VKKIALISILSLLLLLGCEEKTDDPLGPYPIAEESVIARFIEEGWNAYNIGDYELAYARFDSALRMDAGNSSIYVGLGFANMQLAGEEESRFDMAKSSFGFVPTLEGSSPIKDEEDGNLKFWYVTSDSSLFGLSVEPRNTPILGIFEPVVQFIPGAGSPASEQELDVVRITENTIVTEVTEIGGDLYIPSHEDSIAYEFTYDTTLFWIDTIIVVIDTLTSDTIIYEHLEIDTLVDTLVLSGDRMTIDYGYFDGEVSPTLALAFAGYAQTAQILGKNEPEDLLEAIIYAKATIEDFGDEGSLRSVIPDYIDPDITSRNIRILLAQSYFYYGFLYNCMWELWTLDPALQDSIDPDSPSFERDLQRFLEGM